MLKTLKSGYSIWPSSTTESGRAWRYSLTLWVWQRLALTLAGLIVAFFFHPNNTHFINLLPPQVYASTSGWQYFFTSPWQRWDTEEYLAIASSGYGLHPALSNYPPLYPALFGLVGRMLFDNFLLAALLVSNLAYTGALYFLYRLTTFYWNENAARYACIALVCFPTSHFFLMGYSESLFLLLVTATFYIISQNRWWWGCVLACFATLTRLQGIILLLPLGYIYWQQHRFKKFAQNEKEAIPAGKLKSLIAQLAFKPDLNILGLLLVPLGIGLFELYVQQSISNTDELGGLSKYWGIQVTWPGDTLATAIWKIFQSEPIYIPIYNIWGLFLLGLISFTLWRGRHTLPGSFQLYAWGSILLYLTRKGDVITTVSLERYLILIFPAFMYVGLLLSRKQAFYRRRLVLFSVSFLLQWTLAFAFPFWFWTG